MIIHVTHKHINDGVGLSCSGCPVALALAEATGTEWIVSRSGMNYQGPFAGFGWSDDVETPESVKKAIRDFDRDGTMKPFSFELEYSL